MCDSLHLCLHLLCITLTDSEGPTAHAHYLWHCFLVKSDICTTALLSMLFIISTQGLQINQGAKWRWYLLYLFMKLPSRHRTEGSERSGWMQTRAKYAEMLSAQIRVYPPCEKETPRRSQKQDMASFKVLYTMIYTMYTMSLTFAKSFYSLENIGPLYSEEPSLLSWRRLMSRSRLYETHFEKAWNSCGKSHSECHLCYENVLDTAPWNTWWGLNGNTGSLGRLAR